MVKKRNGEIDLLRFLFSLVVVAYHIGSYYEFAVFDYGYIGVEFFFLVSGYLMVQHTERNRLENGNLDTIADETWRYIFRKCKSFYPYYLCAIFAQVVIRLGLVRQYGAEKIMNYFLESIPTFTLTFMGLNFDDMSLYVGNTWFLSSLMLASFILYPLLLKYRRFAIKIIFPVISLTIFCYLYRTYHYIQDWSGFTVCVYNGVLKALAEMALGASLYPVVDWISRRYITVSVAGKTAAIKIMMTAAKVFCYGVVINFASGKIKGQEFDLHAFLFLAVAVALSFSSTGYCIQDGRLTRYLGKISLPIFIFHGFLRRSIYEHLGERIPAGSRMSFVLFFVTLILVSVGFMYLTDLIMKLLKHDGKEKLRTS